MVNPLDSPGGRPLWYRLEGRETVPCDFEEWVATFHKTRQVALTEGGGVSVSTIFLGIDGRVFGPARLFETMVFGGPLDLSQDRYSTLDEAEEGHRAWVAKAGLPANPDRWEMPNPPMRSGPHGSDFKLTRFGEEDVIRSGEEDPDGA